MEAAGAREASEEQEMRPRMMGMRLLTKWRAVISELVSAGFRDGKWSNLFSLRGSERAGFAN